MVPEKVTIFEYNFLLIELYFVWKTPVRPWMLLLKEPIQLQNTVHFHAFSPPSPISESNGYPPVNFGESGTLGLTAPSSNHKKGKPMAWEIKRKKEKRRVFVNPGSGSKWRVGQAIKVLKHLLQNRNTVQNSWAKNNSYVFPGEGLLANHHFVYIGARKGLKVGLKAVDQLVRFAKN